MKGYRHKQYLLIVILTLLVFFSCRKSEVYYQFANIRDSEWTQSDTLYFHVDSSLIEPDALYKIDIELEYNASYPYRNVWLYVQDNIADSTFSLQGKEFLLADEFGKWYGAGFGALYQLSFPYRDSVYFSGRQNYTIKIIHGMRDNPLVGIEKVGIRMKREGY